MNQSLNLVLRPVRESDAGQVLSAFADPAMSRQGKVTDRAAATEYAKRQAANRYARAIDISGAMVGLVAIEVDDANLLGWFHYWLHRDYRGRGITKRAAATLANWALTSGGLERLELGHRVNNPASGAVARAAGFVHEGVERKKFLVDGQRIDVHTYGRLASDPAPATPALPQLFL